jgi:hypothetical protein
MEASCLTKKLVKHILMRLFLHIKGQELGLEEYHQT